MVVVGPARAVFGNMFRLDARGEDSQEERVWLRRLRVNERWTVNEGEMVWHVGIASEEGVSEDPSPAVGVSPPKEERVPCWERRDLSTLACSSTEACRPKVRHAWREDERSGKERREEAKGGEDNKKQAKTRQTNGEGRQQADSRRRRTTCYSPVTA